MKPTDKVDDLLAKAGARWRTDQPSAPEPDLDRILQNSPKSRRWVPALAAASVALIATAALIVLPDQHEAVPPPPVASSNDNPLVRNDDPVVRNGDKVEVDGEVVAAPGKPVVYCIPMATPAIAPATGQAKPPACVAGEEIEVTGVDLNRLSRPTTVQGVRAGFAHLVGIWTNGKIAVEQQSAPVPVKPEVAPKVPCAAPAGGWREGNDAELVTPAVEAFVAARLDQLGPLSIGWPEGYATNLGSAVPNKPSVLMVGVAHGDLTLIRTALTPLVSGNLCVTPVKYSQNEVKQALTAVNALPAKDLRIYSTGSGIGDRPVSVSLLVLDEKAFAALSPIGLDKLVLEPVVKPVR